MMKKFRTANRLSMNAAASLIPTDWGTWRRWETGATTPSLDSALRIADVTGIPVEAWRSEPAKPAKLVKVA